MRVLVTGGGGFLGTAIVRRLLERDADVRTFHRGTYPHLRDLGARQFHGDLADDRDLLKKAADGCELVFHVAAKAGVWGPYPSYHRPNVIGTRHVLDVCQELGVHRLVYTSSPSVVFDGHDENGIDESAPYPGHYLAHYPHTKALAEQLVLESAGETFAAMALRPHLIWGPGDPHLVPRIIDRARAGRLRLVGRRRNLVDATYIDNAADAHLQAAERLTPHAACNGKAYFIGNGEPVPMADLINGILEAAGLPPVTRTISPRTAYLAGSVLEGVHRLFRRRGEPLMTRFVARQLSTSHWFDLSAAREDFGYHPVVRMKDGLDRLRHWLEAETSP